MSIHQFFMVSACVVGASVLSGCTTPEVRKNTGVKNNLTFFSETASEQPMTTPEKPITPPPTKENNSVIKKKMYTISPQMSIDPMKTYKATFKTDQGDIVVQLTASITPITVNNFVFLSREKFYDDTIFHRTIARFMIQGGDPEGTGMGGPGYSFDDEPFQGIYERGTLAMANSGPNTNGSQFFIMHQKNALPPNYVIFGTVVSGMDVVDAIAMAPTKPGGEGSSPVTPVRIRTIEISEEE